MVRYSFHRYSFHILAQTYYNSGVAKLTAPHLRIRTRSSPERRSFLWQIFRGVIRLSILFLVGAVVWYVTRLPFFSLDTIHVSGGETISHDDITMLVSQELRGAYFLIVPKKFTYLYPQDRIHDVLAQNQQLYDIEVLRTSRNELSVRFKEYIPHALWCSDSGTDSYCYYITESGHAFAKAPTLVGGSFVRHITEGQSEVREGEKISKEELARIDTFIQALSRNYGFRVSAVVHKNNGDITFGVNGGGELFVTGGKSFDTVLENIGSILASSEFSHIKPGNFKYIDMRFDNKVFVNESLGETSTTTEAGSTLSD